MTMFWRRAAVALVVLASVACKGGGAGDASPSSPTSGGGGLPGTWTGTLARPNGQPAVTVRWEIGAQNPDFSNTGPMTLTNGATSITVPGRATASGNDSSGYDLHVSINSNAGDVAGLPNCAVRASPQGAPPRFTSPYRSITVPLQISYSSCEAFIAPPPPGNFMQENVQLTLAKQ